MRYRTTVAGRTFLIDVDDLPSGERKVTVHAEGTNGNAAAIEAALAQTVGSLHVLRLGARVASVEIAKVADAFEVALPGQRPLRVEVEDGRAPAARDAGGARRAGPSIVRAIMPGIVRKVLVAKGAHVAANDALVILEAMKMQNEIRSESAGVVSRVHVAAGQSIASGEPLLELAPAG